MSPVLIAFLFVVAGGVVVYIIEKVLDFRADDVGITVSRKPKKIAPIEDDPWRTDIPFAAWAADHASRLDQITDIRDLDNFDSTDFGGVRAAAAQTKPRYVDTIQGIPLPKREIEPYEITTGSGDVIYQSPYTRRPPEKGYLEWNHSTYDPKYGGSRDHYLCTTKKHVLSKYRYTFDEPEEYMKCDGCDDNYVMDEDGYFSSYSLPF